MARDLNKVLLKFPFTVPNYFALTSRAVTILEGIGLKADPEFDIWTASYPYAKQRAFQIFV